MTTDATSAWQIPPWRAALRIRAEVLKRRHASPLEVAVLLVVCGLTWMVGKALAPRVLADPTLLPMLALAGPLVVLGLLTSTANTLLYASRELVLLLGHGLSPQGLVRVRLVELSLLALLGGIPLAVCLSGALLANGAPVSPWLLGVVLVGAPALAGAALLLAWCSANRTGIKRLLLLLGVAGIAGVIVARPQPPGAWILSAAAGELLPLLGLTLVSALAVVGALLVAPRDFAQALDRGVGRTHRGAPRTWRLLGLLTAPLGGQTGALVRRDVTLLLRGGFLRGTAILTLLPLALGIVLVVRTDPSLERWHLVLVGVLLIGVLSSASGFLFGVDFPRHRRGQLLLERTQPLRGVSVLLSRWVPAASYALVLVGVVALLIATAEPRLARGVGSFVPRGLLIALIITHHAVTYGMRSEGQLDPAEAAAYPMNGAAVVILFGLGLMVHPAVAIAYPLLWSGFMRQAVAKWETAEIESEHQAAA